MVDLVHVSIKKERDIKRAYGKKNYKLEL